MCAIPDSFLENGRMLHRTMKSMRLFISETRQADRPSIRLHYILLPGQSRKPLTAEKKDAEILKKQSKQ